MFPNPDVREEGIKYTFDGDELVAFIAFLLALLWPASGLLIRGMMKTCLPTQIHLQT